VLRETDGVTPLADAQRQHRVHRGKRRAARPLVRGCGLQLNVYSVRPTPNLAVALPPPFRCRAASRPPAGVAYDMRPNTRRIRCVRSAC